MVTHGIYAYGGRAVDGTMTNRVAVGKPPTLRSVKVPQFTIIQGCQVPGTTNGDSTIRFLLADEDYPPEMPHIRVDDTEDDSTMEQMIPSGHD